MLAVLRLRGVVLCSVTITRVLLKVLGENSVLVPLCHASECGCFEVLIPFCR